MEEEEEKVEEGPIGIVKAIEYWQRSDSLANKGLSGQSDRAEMPTVAPGGGGGGGGGGGRGHRLIQS